MRGEGCEFEVFLSGSFKIHPRAAALGLPKTKDGHGLGVEGDERVWEAGAEEWALCRLAGARGVVGVGSGAVQHRSPAQKCACGVQCG